MPVIFQYITYLNPLRYFLVIIRGIFLKGTALGPLAQMAALFVLGTVIIAISSFRFARGLDRGSLFKGGLRENNKYNSNILVTTRST